MPVVLFDPHTGEGCSIGLTGPVRERGMISNIDPDLVTITDDIDEAVDVATSMVPRQTVRTDPYGMVVRITGIQFRSAPPCRIIAMWR